jgi:hypothetical protein
MVLVSCDVAASIPLTRYGIVICYCMHSNYGNMHKGYELFWLKICPKLSRECPCWQGRLVRRLETRRHRLKLHPMTPIHHPIVASQALGFAWPTGDPFLFCVISTHLKEVA